MRKIPLIIIFILVLMTACNQEKKDMEKNTQHIHLVVSMTVKPECRDELMAAFKTMITETRKEKGCVAYYLMEKENTPNDFVLIEEWETQADLDSHGNTTHFAEYKKATAGKMETSVLERAKLVY